MTTDISFVDLVEQNQDIDKEILERWYNSERLQNQFICPKEYDYYLKQNN